MKVFFVLALIVAACMCSTEVIANPNTDREETKEAEGVILHCYCHAMSLCSKDTQEDQEEGAKMDLSISLSPEGINDTWNMPKPGGVDRVVCSDTLSAKETALLLFYKRESIEETLKQSVEALGIDIEPAIAGVNYGDIIGAFGQENAEASMLIKQFSTGDKDFPGFPNGDNFDTFRERVLEGFRGIIKSSKPGSHVYVISSRGPLTEVLNAIGRPRELPIKSLEKVDLSKEDCEKIVKSSIPSS